MLRRTPWVFGWLAIYGAAELADLSDIETAMRVRAFSYMINDTRVPDRPTPDYNEPISGAFQDAFPTVTCDLVCTRLTCIREIVITCYKHAFKIVYESERRCVYIHTYIIYMYKYIVEHIIISVIAPLWSTTCTNIHTNSSRILYVQSFTISNFARRLSSSTHAYARTMWCIVSSWML